MSWSIPDFFVIRKPREIKYLAWGVTYFISLIVFYVISSYLLRNSSDNYFFYFLAFIGITIIIGIALGIRLFLYENDLMRYESWEKQRIETKAEWCKWATKRVAILASEVITPNINLGNKLVLNKKEQILIEQDKVLTLSLLTELVHSSRYEQAFEWLLSLLKEKIEKVSVNNELKIYCITGEHADKNLEKCLFKAWRKVNLMGSYRPEFVGDEFSINECIDTLLKIERSQPVLVLTCQFSPSVTEFISATILSNEFQTGRISIEPLSYAERSMLTDEYNISTDLKIMKEFGQISSSVNPPLWFNSITENVQTEVLSTLCSINNDHDMNETNFINSILGKTGNLSEWLVFNLITNLVFYQKTPNIMISKGKNNILILGVVDK